MRFRLAGGISRGGYKLAYTDTESDFLKKLEARRKYADFTFSMGFSVGRQNKLSDVLWGGRAQAAGLTAAGAAAAFAATDAL